MAMTSRIDHCSWQPGAIDWVFKSQQKYIGGNDTKEPLFASYWWPQYNGYIVVNIKEPSMKIVSRSHHCVFDGRDTKAPL